MKNKLLTTILSACMLASMLTGCAGKNQESKTKVEDYAGQTSNTTVSETVAGSIDISNGELVDEVENVVETASEIDFYMAEIAMDMTSVEAYEGLFAAATSVEAPEVAGEWYRTNTFSDTNSTITVESITQDGFDFSVTAVSGDSISDFTSHAFWVSENVAITKSEEFGTEYVLFVWNNEELQVFCSDYCNSLGLALNVTIDGEYTQDEPEYIDFQ